MRIAFVGAEGVPYPNAFAKITEEAGWRLAGRGHDVSVYCRSHFVSDSSRYRGMKRVIMPSLNTKHFDTITAAALSILHAIVRERPDVVHIHGIGPSPLSALGRMAGLKVVVQVHGLDWKRPKWGRVARFCLRGGEVSSAYLPNATIVVSEALQRYYKDQYHRDVVFVPQGVDPPELRSANHIAGLGLESRQYILFMGRLVPEKGCHHLIKAYLGTDTSMPLVIAGGGAHTSGYVDELYRLGSDKRIQFLGHVTGDSKAELLTNAYLYVQPSELEGLSLALLEAMAYGNCALVSDIPENYEATKGHAFAFRNKDVRDLQDNLLALLSNPGAVRQKGLGARDYVISTYSWDRVTDAYEQVYANVLKN